MVEKIKEKSSLIKNYFKIKVINKILIKLKLREKHDYLISEKKIELENKIRKISNYLVLYGSYKNTFLSCKNNWNISDNCSKLLGLYEKQIQENSVNLKKKYALKYVVNFGASDGFHILGLIKNNFFDEGLAFEIDDISREYLVENIEKNNLSSRIKTFSNANFSDVFKILSDDKLKKTLFLIDIEGQEFDLFNDENLGKLNNSFFIIENHEFFIKDKNKIKKFRSLIENYFKVNLINNSSRDPFKIELLNNFNDDEKWLMMSESRPQTMNWLLLKPKKIL